MIDYPTLPQTLPSEDAIASFKQNKNVYTPEAWELEYGGYRYLANLSDAELIKRHQCIQRNMRAITHADRYIIPLQCYQGLWYWYRKEHQTRVEFSIRELEPPPAYLEESEANTTHPGFVVSIPDGRDTIYRYGKREHMAQMVHQGLIRVSPAKTYDDEGLNEARKDNELQKISFMAGQYTTITFADGRKVKPIGDVKRRVEGPNYHPLCFSCVWDDTLFDEFDADTCVVVFDPGALATRLKSAGHAVFPQWPFFGTPVQYFDPYALGKYEFFNWSKSKDLRFMYQYEYRFLWTCFDAPPIEGSQYLNIGPAPDIMTMFDRSRNLVAA